MASSAILTDAESPSLFTLTTVLSLLATVAILATAYFASLTLLPSTTSSKLRGLYIWHLSDALCHFILEGSFLYNCFFTYTELAPTFSATADYPAPASLGAGVKFPHFLGYANRSYGPVNGDNPFAKLWQEYAIADARWGGADLGVVSLEILTVFLAGPCALYVSELIRKGAGRGAGGGVGEGSAKLWFWATMLATGELYGGFMTFSPEWLSGNTNLDGRPFYFWLYLVFFNMLWVFIPIWVLYEALGSMKVAYNVAAKATAGKKNH